ncbi:MAG: ABC transporter permease [Candidatus Zixiibacteriota bacterium]|nr:MAG: ABC transporter permease [candidate division Zixibacteria bacterium]
MTTNHVNSQTRSSGLRRLLSDYGMAVVLILLCLLFSILTVSERHPTGVSAARSLFEETDLSSMAAREVLIVIQASTEDSVFGHAVYMRLLAAGCDVEKPMSGTPEEIRTWLEGLAAAGRQSDLIITSHACFPVVESIRSQMAGLSAIEVREPPSYRWPTFLLAENLKNVANQITVIAIIAIGMTMVIITAGIDLSVGSLIALSAVVVAWLVGQMGGNQATTGAMIVAVLGGTLLCGTIGAFSGLMVTRFSIPPFIATLAMMQVAAGLAYIVSQGRPIYQLPDNFIWLGRGVDPVLHVPNAVILMLVLYAVAHIVMTRTTFGRYVYAVGGNREAARLAGIRVNLVLFAVYAICGLLAGLGGVVMASQLKSGAPTYGLTYELYVIAAVVVGGTSLMGGEGRILGTLIGAFIIAVIQNGMNLTNVESYTQKVILGLVILAAVLVDRLKQTGFKAKIPKLNKDAQSERRTQVRLADKGEGNAT